MNRQTILASINRHLRESFAETGEVRPLGEIVSTVANDIRGQFSASETSQRVTARVIPVEQVAAFIDGRLTSAESQDICDAIGVDNSVLAELIAAVRATQQQSEQLPRLPDALSAQLLAMSSQLPVATTPSAATSPSAAIVEPSADEFQKDASGVNPTVGVNVFAASNNGRVQPRSSRKHRPLTLVAGILTVAATIVGIVFLAVRDQPQTPDETQLVELEPSDPALQPGDEIQETDRLPGSDPQEVMIVGVDPDPALKANPTLQTEKIDDANIATPLSPRPDSVANDDRSDKEMQPSIAEIPKLDHTPPVTPSTPAPPRLADLKWTEITGLLARQDLPSEGSTARRAATWTSVQASSSAANESIGGRVSLRTMPLSRAEAKLEGGGRVVIAGDSGMLIAPGGAIASAEIDVHHGSIAMIDLPNGTVINLRSGDRLLASLRWAERGTAVLQRGADGIEVHVDNGTITVNDEPQNDESLTIAEDRSIQKIDRPKRLPSWVDRPVDAIGIPRTILAQIAVTDNVTRTLNQRINEMASAQRLSVSDQRTLATLANWQAAMADTNLFRLANSRVPAMRLAALQRLVNMPHTDPRYRRTWINIERMTANQQRVSQIRRWCEMARNGVKPNPAQIEQMITGLSSQDIASRAMADFMLRQFYGNNVPFDPTWTGQQQQRAINLWRQRVGLPNARGAAPAAAAGN